jgi:transcriptional regulator with XRE-family HTH domain
MRTLNDYLDAACARHGISDNRLSQLLGIRRQTLHAWRGDLTQPREDTLLALADLAGIPGDQALIEAAIWRCSKTGQLQARERLLDALSRLENV